MTDAVQRMIENPEIQELYEIHSVLVKDWCMTDFANFFTLDEAVEESKKRLEDDKVRHVEIFHYYRKDGHVVTNGKEWIVKRKPLSEGQKA